MTKRWIAAASLLALLVAGCGTTAEPPADEATVGAASPQPSAGEDASGRGSDSDERPRGKGAGSSEKDKKAGGPGNGNGGAEVSGGGDGTEGGSPGAEGGATTPEAEGEAGDDAGSGTRSPSERGGPSGSRAPQAGTYTYSQRGFEEFCSAGCDRNKLPRRQRVVISIPQRSSSTVTVVTEARSSGGRVSRSTARYTDAAAFITEVYVRFTYAGYEFEQTYRPNPPVENLRFPLRVGANWSGSWKGKVSGNYSVSVTDKARVSAGGRTVEAFELETSTRFRGDFEGTANATIWVDPRTTAVLRTAGNVHVESGYGSYSTGFATALLSGPGY